MRGYVHIYHNVSDCLTLFVGGLQKCGWERENGLKMGEKPKKATKWICCENFKWWKLVEVGQMDSTGMLFRESRHCAAVKEISIF